MAGRDIRHESVTTTSAGEERRTQLRRLLVGAADAARSDRRGDAGAPGVRDLALDERHWPAAAAQVPEDAAPDDQAQRPQHQICLLYTSPSPRDVEESRMPSSA